MIKILKTVVFLCYEHSIVNCLLLLTCTLLLACTGSRWLLSTATEFTESGTKLWSFESCHCVCFVILTHFQTVFH